ncbi:MAG: GH3 auxin-responsive promoter family protein [Kiloniellales bacterium]
MLDATPLLRLYARHRLRRLRAQDPVEEQKRQLHGLLARARNTRFGKDHGFADIRGIDDFQARVPLRRYEQFWGQYWKPAFPRLVDCTWPGTIPFFAVTSGTTTGITKYIPCSREMIGANKRATMVLLSYHLASRPRSRLLAGRNFMLGGSIALVELAPGIHSGDLSGIGARTIPWWARLRYFPPRRLETISDWQEKIEHLAPLSLGGDIRSISGTPSWLLIFFDRLAELRPGSGRRLHDFYPDLELLIHGGINFAPYRGTFAELLEGSHAETREAYAASEGFIAAADRGDGEGLRLILDTGLFCEFVPVDELDAPNPTRHWIANARVGVNYAVVLSTCAGLWAYVIGDTVKFVDLDPPRILVTGRTSYTLSAFGEHLIDEEIEESVTAAADAIGAAVIDYSAGPLFPEREGELGGHLYVVEFVERVPDAQRLGEFTRALDEELAATNDDYKAHRAGGYGMRAPRVHAVEPGSFAAWMKERGQLGGQHKVPRIINDPELFRNLRAFMGCA